MRQIVPSILKYAPEAILLVATNPVDVITHFVARFAEQNGVGHHHVIGTGTTLDTARFRALLGRYIGVDPQHIHGYVVGEHGDSEVLTWSLTSVGGIPLEEFCRETHHELCTEHKEEIDQQVRRAAYNIIAGKGATYYGIGSAVARIIEVILRDQLSIMTVCTLVDRVGEVENVTLSLPQLVGGNGVINALPLPLSPEEASLLEQSARIIRDSITALNEGQNK
jgi:L-lactate dehydrogenase